MAGKGPRGTHIFSYVTEKGNEGLPTGGKKGSLDWMIGRALDNKVAGRYPLKREVAPGSGPGTPDRTRTAGANAWNSSSSKQTH